MTVFGIEIDVKVVGKWAGICAMILGAILVIVGAVVHPTSIPLIVTGGAFIVVGFVVWISAVVT